MTASNPVSHAEEALVFAVEGESVIGILHRGSTSQSTGVLLVVGGRQYRAGAHRQFVSLARHLSANGYPVLRFDMRGMGDSSGAPINFLDSAPDIAAALKVLRLREPQLERILLWGLCDGASAALLLASEHAAVDGVMMVNPWVTTDAGSARTQLKHYYTKRLVSANFWKKLVTGNVSWWQSAASLRTELKRILVKITSNDDANISLPDKVFKAMENFNGTVSVVISVKDLTAIEFKAEYDRRYAKNPDATSRWNVMSVDSDHTFSTPDNQAQLESLTVEWVKTNQFSH